MEFTLLSNIHNQLNARDNEYAEHDAALNVFLSQFGSLDTTDARVVESTAARDRAGEREWMGVKGQDKYGLADRMANVTHDGQTGEPKVGDFVISTQGRGVIDEIDKDGVIGVAHVGTKEFMGAVRRDQLEQPRKFKDTIMWNVKESKPA